jgi:uncharacterized protein (DUF3084 family)
MNRAAIEILEKLINDAEAHAKASESAATNPSEKREVSKFKQIAHTALKNLINLFKKMVGKRVNNLEPFIKDISKQIREGWDEFKALQAIAKKLIESIGKLKDAINAPKVQEPQKEGEQKADAATAPTVNKDAEKLAGLEADLLLTNGKLASLKQTLQTKAKIWNGLDVNAGHFGKSIAAEQEVVAATKAMKQAEKELA